MSFYSFRYFPSSKLFFLFFYYFVFFARDREAADEVPFEQFRQQYLAQDLMGGEHFEAARPATVKRP